MEDTGSGAWGFAVILGPIILAAILVYGTMHYRRRGRGPTAPRSYDHSQPTTTTDSVSQTGAADRR